MRSHQIAIKKFFLPYLEIKPIYYSLESSHKELESTWPHLRYSEMKALQQASA